MTTMIISIMLSLAGALIVDVKKDERDQSLQVSAEFFLENTERCAKRDAAHTNLDKSAEINHHCAIEINIQQNLSSKKGTSKPTPRPTRRRPTRGLTKKGKM